MSAIPVSTSRARIVWDALREYSTVRIYLRDLIPGLPGIVKPFVRESVGVGGLLTKLIGPDPEAK